MERNRSINSLSILIFPKTSGIYYNATLKTVVITKDGLKLDHIDFRGVTIYVQANNVTISNAMFDASTGSVAVREFDGYKNLTIDHATFNGLKLDKAFMPILATGSNTTVTNSLFHDLQSDGITIASGRIAGNLISGSGYQTGAHADAISISGIKTNGPITIENNVIDWRDAADAKVATNQAIRVTSDSARSPTSRSRTMSCCGWLLHGGHRAGLGGPPASSM